MDSGDEGSDKAYESRYSIRHMVYCYLLHVDCKYGLAVMKSDHASLQRPFLTWACELHNWVDVLYPTMRVGYYKVTLANAYLRHGIYEQVRMNTLEPKCVRTAATGHVWSKVATPGAYS